MYTKAFYFFYSQQCTAHNNYIIVDRGGKELDYSWAHFSCSLQDKSNPQHLPTTELKQSKFPHIRKTTKLLTRLNLWMSNLNF